MRTGAGGWVDGPSQREGKEAGGGGWQVTLYLLSGGRVNRKWGRALKPQGFPAVTHFLQLRLHPEGSTVSQTAAPGENQAFKHTRTHARTYEPVGITSHSNHNRGILGLGKSGSRKGQGKYELANSTDGGDVSYI